MANNVKAGVISTSSDVEDRKPILKIPEDEVERYQIISQSYSDMMFFCKRILGYETPKHFRDWNKIIQGNELICLLASRGFGKSVFSTFVYPLWRMFRGDVLEIVIFSCNKDESSRRLEHIRNEIESNPWLAHLDNSGGGSWGKERFVTKPPRDNFKKGIEVTAMGISSARRGRHPHLIILDDILTETTTITMDQVKHVFNYVIMNMLKAKNKKLIIVGTPFDYDDIYADLSENPSFTFRKFPAIDEDGNLLWEEQWTYEALMERKSSIGDLAFTREILLEPVSSSISYFKEEYIEHARRKTFSLGEIPDNRQITVISCDFGFSAARKAAFTVFTVVTKVGSSYRVLDFWRSKGATIAEMDEVLARFTRKYGVDVIVAEDTGPQVAWVRELSDKGHFIHTITTSGQNKNSILGALNHALQKRWMIIPANENDVHTDDYNRILITELKSFIARQGKLISVGRSSDAAMSLSFAIHYLLENWGMNVNINKDIHGISSTKYLEFQGDMDRILEKSDKLRKTYKSEDWEFMDEPEELDW